MEDFWEDGEGIGAVDARFNNKNGLRRDERALSATDSIILRPIVLVICNTTIAITWCVVSEPSSRGGSKYHRRSTDSGDSLILQSSPPEITKCKAQHKCQDISAPLLALGSGFFFNIYRV